MMTYTEQALKTSDCFFAACRNGNLSHFIDHVQFEHLRGGNLVSVLAGTLEDVRIFGFYGLIRLTGYEPVLCVLTLYRS